MHPIKRVCEEKGITYEQFAVLVNHKAGAEVLKADYVPILACGARKPSPELALRIEQAFPDIKKEDLIWPKAINGKAPAA